MRRKRKKYKQKLLDCIAELCALGLLMATGAVVMLLLIMNPHMHMFSTRGFFTPVKILQNPGALVASAGIGAGFGAGLYAWEGHKKHRRQTAVTNVKRDLARRASMRGSLLSD